MATNVSVSMSISLLPSIPAYGNQTVFILYGGGLSESQMNTDEFWWATRLDPRAVFQSIFADFGVADPSTWVHAGHANDALAYSYYNRTELEDLYGEETTQIGGALVFKGFLKYDAVLTRSVQKMSEPFSLEFAVSAVSDGDCPTPIVYLSQDDATLFNSSFLRFEYCSEFGNFRRKCIGTKCVTCPDLSTSGTKRITIQVGLNAVVFTDSECGVLSVPASPFVNGSLAVFIGANGPRSSSATAFHWVAVARWDEDRNLNWTRGELDYAGRFVTMCQTPNTTALVEHPEQHWVVDLSLNGQQYEPYQNVLDFYTYDPSTLAAYPARALVDRPTDFVVDVLDFPRSTQSGASVRFGS